MDVRSALSAIAVPTLMLHRSNFSLVPISTVRYLADHIPARSSSRSPERSIGTKRLIGANNAY
jgi:pimeloyl-ACP methyl ester carboxylesterase